MFGSFVFLLVIAIAAIAFAAYMKKMQQGGFSREEVRVLRTRAIGLGIVIVVIAVIAAGIVTIPVGEKMVVYNKFGKTFRTPLSSGWNYLLPGVYELYLYDTRTQVYTMSGIAQEGDVARSDAIEVLSSDGLKIDVDITIQFKPQADMLNELHQEVGPTYVDKIIRPSSREAIRNEFAKYEATQVYSEKREDIETNLQDRLASAFTDYYIVLDEVQIRNIQLPPTVVAAIEEKKAAQQEAERMIYVLEKERQEKDRVKIEAEAQAERIEIVNAALAANPNYLNWLAIDKLNDNIELVISDGKTILNLDAMKASQ